MSGVRITVGTGSKRATVDPVAAALLRRAGLVAPGLLAGGRKVKQPGRRSVPIGPGLLALEADVLALGYLLGPRLRAYLAEQAVERLAAIGLGLLAALESTVGADKPHVPLFRKFPRSVPADTFELYVQRVFTLLLQEPHQPCVLCGQVSTVHPVAPCAHLICAACWDLDDYAGCPLCHRRINLAEPFLDPAGAAPDTRHLPPPRRVAVLELVDDLNRSVYQAIAVMLARRTPLSPQDRGDLGAMLDRVGHGDLGWLPEEIPIRETRAVVLARLVADPSLADRLPGLVTTHIGTATDALRLLYVLHGGDAGLVTAPERRRSLPRRLRRVLLARLDALPLAALVEDLHRHGAAWQRMAENLHPFEQASRHPAVAAAFAALRGTPVDTATGFGRLLADVAAAHPAVLHHDGGRLRASGWAARVENAVAGGDVSTAVGLLAQRPGVLARRLVEVASRTDDPEALVTAAGTALRTVSPGVLLAALGAIRVATWPAGTRLYFPRGGTARLWAEPDHRPRLDANLGGALDAMLAGEMLDRAAGLPAVDVAMLDAGLADLVAPFTERTASATLVRLPRGSSQLLPHGRILRLFLHWTQPAGTRIDLDLSVAMYDSAGGFVGWCDYTRLRFADRAAVHSGDLTSAPAPLGASEFVDLDVAALRRQGIRYLTMVVFSYNDVPFEAMTDAFAGFMGDPGGGRRAFEPKAVEQRFDLTGSAKVATPLLVDLDEGRMRWVDAAMTGTGSEHSVRRYSRTLGRLTVAADRYFAAGRRVSLWEVACWHAAARAATVLVRHRDRTVVGYRRAAAETPSAFAARLAALSTPDDNLAAPGEPLPDFAVLVSGDAELAKGAQTYALYRSRLDASTVSLVDAGDLIGALAR